jgi:hypothetical protein
MQSNFADAIDFCARNGVQQKSEVELLSDDKYNFHLGSLMSAINNFKQASHDNNVKEVIESLILIAIMAMSTAHIMGSSDEQWQQSWNNFINVG